MESMEYMWKSSLWIGTFEGAKQRNDQENCWPTMYRAGAAVVSTINSGYYTSI